MLSDVDKLISVAKDSTNISFLVSGEDGEQGCVIRWGEEKRRRGGGGYKGYQGVREGDIWIGGDYKPDELWKDQMRGRIVFIVHFC